MQRIVLRPLPAQENCGVYVIYKYFCKVKGHLELYLQVVEF